MSGEKSADAQNRFLARRFFCSEKKIINNKRAVIAKINIRRSVEISKIGSQLEDFFFLVRKKAQIRS